LNADGVPDIVVGAPGSGGEAGRVVYFDGVHRDLRWTAEGIVSASDGGSRLGWAVAADVTDKSRVVAGYYWSGHQTGGVRLTISGATGALDTPVAPWTESTRLGVQFESLGDVDFDGKADAASLDQELGSTARNSVVTLSRRSLNGETISFQSAFFGGWG